MRISLLLFALLAACSDVPYVPGVSLYRIDIQQGNMVTQDMVDKLVPGMSRAQVRFTLGTPLVADAFHPDRWDYVYLYNKAGHVTEKRRLVVIFKDDKFVRVEGDKMPPPPVTKTGPSETKPVPAAAVPKPDATAAKPDAGAQPEGMPPLPEPDATATEAPQEVKGEEKGFFGRLLEKLGF